MHFLAVVVAVLVLIAVYDAVAREDTVRERTASEEMWRRTLQDFQNDERRAGRFPGHPDTGVQQTSRG